MLTSEKNGQEREVLQCFWQ